MRRGAALSTAARGSSLDTLAQLRVDHFERNRTERWRTGGPKQRDGDGGDIEKLYAIGMMLVLLIQRTWSSFWT